MRIFITGPQGFIGKETARQAQIQGHDVMGLEKPFRVENPPWSALEAFRPEVCIHTAWIATPGIYVTSPLNESHRVWGCNLAVGLARLGMKHLISLGTCAEYTPSPHLLNEGNSPINPTSPYGLAKKSFHDDLRGIAALQGFTLSWARVFYPYGPDEHSQRLVSSLIRGFEENQPLLIENPNAVRDYIHVEDVASALLLMAERKVHGTVNIGTGKGVRIGTLESTIARLMNIPFDDKSETMAQGMGEAVVAEIGKLKAMGWTPRYDHIESGLQTYPSLSPKSTNQ
jgi:dTDP-6-deoxy-L-talose 4-dehydrogenase (NAD+)